MYMYSTELLCSVLNFSVCVCVCCLSQHHSEDTVPPPRRLLLHQPLPLPEQTAGSSALCSSGLSDQCISIKLRPFYLLVCVIILLWGLLETLDQGSANKSGNKSTSTYGCLFSCPNSRQRKSLLF